MLSLLKGTLKVFWRVLSRYLFSFLIYRHRHCNHDCHRRLCRSLQAHSVSTATGKLWSETQRGDLCLAEQHLLCTGPILHLSLKISLEVPAQLLSLLNTKCEKQQKCDSESNPCFKKSRVTFVFVFGDEMNVLYKEDEILWSQSFVQPKSCSKFRFGNIDQHTVLCLSF